MSDHWTFYKKLTAPTALDVVWCRFPFVEDPNTPNPKSRPALVRRVLRKNGHLFVEVVYGTSKLQRFSDGAADLIVANLRDMIEAGLPQATVFLLGRTRILPWAEEWFEILLNNKTPVVGHLSSHSQEYLRYLRRRG